MRLALLKDIMKRECFALQQQVDTWENAVRIGCNLLEKDGCITEEYYQEIIINTKKLGAYYVIAPRFAMPHASPDCGVIKTGVSLVTLKTPVVFGSPNDPVDLLIVFSAVSKKEMEEGIIMQIINFLEDEEFLTKLRNTHNLVELVNSLEA